MDLTFTGDTPAFRRKPWAVLSDFAFEAGEIQIWAVRLDLEEQDVAKLRTVLSDAELRRAEGFALPRDRRCFIASHGHLRRILAKYAHVNASEIGFEHGSNGKPHLARPATNIPIHFNMSHCEGIVVIGVAAQHIGVDVERIREIDDCLSIARTFFSPEECAILEPLRPCDRYRAFFRCWTRKEAVVKAVGGGLSIPLNSFQVLFGEDSACESISMHSDAPPGGVWNLVDLEPFPGFIGAAAVPFPIVKITATLIVEK